MFGASTMFWIDAGAMALGKVFPAIMVSNCVNITFSVFVMVVYGWGIDSVSLMFFLVGRGITLL